MEGDKERRAVIFIGPEFGTVQRQHLVLVAREAADADFDLLLLAPSITRRTPQSLTSSAASPWGFAPTGKPRLLTTHAKSRHSLLV
jgi:hypothetical protein